MIPKKEINMVPDMGKWKRSQVGSYIQSKHFASAVFVFISYWSDFSDYTSRSIASVTFLCLQAYADYMGFVLTLNEGVKGKKLTCEYNMSEVCCPCKPASVS